MNNVVVTGCSQGIGLATVLELARAGHGVIATMRNLDKSAALREAVETEGLPVRIAALDVTSDESVAACFAAIEGRVEALVNNAGIEYHGSVEEMPVSQMAEIMNTNYLGAVRCIQQVLPGMREARNGCIVNISSVAGRIANSPLGPYCASKHALEAISDALAGEVKPLGIRVAVVEPGIQNTQMAQNVAERVTDSIYPQVRRFGGLFRASLANPVPPEVTAVIVREILESGTWKVRHPSGPDAGPLIGMRAAMTDEQWVDWTAQDDDAWFDQVQREFGLNARC